MSFILHKNIHYTLTIAFVCLILVFPACMQGKQSSTYLEEEQVINHVPSSVDSLGIMHFWDDFKLQDTFAVQNPEIGEQKLVDFIETLAKSSPTEASLSIKSMLSKVKPYPTSFRTFTDLYHRYLYDPNSPMANDTYYQPVLEFILDSTNLKPTEQRQFSSLLDLVKRNQEGTKSINFTFETSKGIKENLHAIDAQYTLLFFYEPGCSYCEDAIEEVRNDLAIQKLLDKRALIILAVYPGGDRMVWKGYQKQIPEAWTNGFDSEMKIVNTPLYDLKASPTLYLLDMDKNVFFKDSKLAKIQRYLGSL